MSVITGQFTTEADQNFMVVIRYASGERRVEYSDTDDIGIDLAEWLEQGPIDKIDISKN